MRQVVRGNMVDMKRKAIFGHDVGPIVLVLYSEDAQELLRLDHFWCITNSRAPGSNAVTVKLVIVEDVGGPSYRDIMSLVQTFRYEIGVTPSIEVSQPYTTDTIGDASWNNNVWEIVVKTESFVVTAFQAP